MLSTMKGLVKIENNGILIFGSGNEWARHEH